MMKTGKNDVPHFRIIYDDGRIDYFPISKNKTSIGRQKDNDKQGHQGQGRPSDLERHG